ncbi:polyprenyl diphosphate synthase [Streptomyces sp. NBC_01429]|uniref:polyprenyl diphosphate synthase n=1 Tax=Streptomyces sp. NBC_01429 TaxID=2903862 RepID=UPI002E28815E|nr:polyprenyl diphosphate synthase [Streptomyces sp. NBC_01429]
MVIPSVPTDPTERAPGPRPCPDDGPPPIPDGRLPGHVAVVLDGNGRWATGRGLPRTEGHRAGAKAVLDTVDGALQLGLRHLSLFAFSTENWRRDPAEVGEVLRLINGFATDHGDWLDRRGVRVTWSGGRGRMGAGLLGDLDALQERTAGNARLEMTVWLNYGARDELWRAARELARQSAEGRIDPADIDARTFARYLYRPDLPDVDLFIRTSGEQRLSNFLLWQSAYAELLFTETLWPDFGRHDLWAATVAYSRRERRFGGH